MVEDFLLGSFYLTIWGLLQILYVVGIKREACRGNGLGLRSALQNL